MTDEATESVEAAKVEETTLPPEVKIVEVKETIVDTSGFDYAIAAQKKLMERAEPDELGDLEVELQRLESKQLEVSKSAETQELAQLRKEKFDRDMTDAFPGVDVAKITGATNEERLNNARKESLRIKDEKIAELEAKIASGEPTPAQVAGWGETPLIPGGDLDPNEVAALDKAVDEADPLAVMQNPAFRKQAGLAP